MKQNSAPTMKDVAREAGVALGTVSKVINGIPVGKAYQDKVNDAIQKLGYKLNTYARGLKTAKTDTITLIVPTLNGPFYASLAHEIEKQTFLHGKKLILCCSDGIESKEIEYISLATQNKTDGIIALTYSDISSYVSEQIPLISFDRHFENCTIPCIASDNYAGGQLAVSKLVEFGCKKPLFIRFRSSFLGEVDKRLAGYLDACKKYNIIPDYLDSLNCNDTYDVILNYIKMHEDSANHTLSFDSIFANTDLHACIIIDILKSLGYSVPQDVQVIGFDGIKKFYQDDEYVVSTIRQPVDVLAKKCLDLILEFETSTLPTVTLLPVTFEYGGSTK